MKFRQAREGDINFILSTWLKSYWESLKRYATGGQFVPIPRAEVFYKEHQEKIKHLLKDATVVVCNPPDDENQIIGYLVYKGDCLHFCYVKNVFRRIGIANKLMALAPGLKTYSHHTTYARHITGGMTYNPYRF